jgi:hypothetical protein
LFYLLFVNDLSDGYATKLASFKSYFDSYSLELLCDKIDDDGTDDDDDAD